MRWKSHYIEYRILCFPFLNWILPDCMCMWPNSNNVYFCGWTKTFLYPPDFSPWLDIPPEEVKNTFRSLSKSYTCVSHCYIVGCKVMSALFVYHRAKLGYGLLSGDYSKPAPDLGEENGASEPRVGKKISHSGFTSLSFNCYLWHMWELHSEINENVVYRLALAVDKTDCSCFVCRETKSVSHHECSKHLLGGATQSSLRIDNRMLRSFYCTS